MTGQKQHEHESCHTYVFSCVTHMRESCHTHKESDRTYVTQIEALAQKQHEDDERRTHEIQLLRQGRMQLCEEVCFPFLFPFPAFFVWTTSNSLTRYFSSMRSVMQIFKEVSPPDFSLFPLPLSFLWTTSDALTRYSSSVRGVCSFSRRFVFLFYSLSPPFLCGRRATHSRDTSPPSGAYAAFRTGFSPHFPFFPFPLIFFVDNERLSRHISFVRSV